MSAGAAIGPTISTAWEKQKVERVCFRGDRRAPGTVFRCSTDQSQETTLEKEGFLPIDPRAQPEYRNPKPDEKIGDAENGVAVTTLFQTAVRFPLQPRRPECWVYAIWIRQAYNTHFHQSRQALELAERGTVTRAAQYQPIGGGDGTDQANSAMWALFGEELVSDGVHPGYIIAAVKCWRENYWELTDWNKRIKYRLLGPLYINPDCRVDPIIREAAIKFLDLELIFHPEGESTIAEMGFSESTGK
jgi:hypothetical protein